MSPDHLPQGLDVFSETLAPILRERGVMRDGYDGPALRENLGIGRPVRGSWRGR